MVFFFGNISWEIKEMFVASVEILLLQNEGINNNFESVKISRRKLLVRGRMREYERDIDRIKKGRVIERER